MTKFPYAGAEIFGLNLSYSAGDGFKQGIVNEYVLSLEEETNLSLRYKRKFELRNRAASSRI